MISISTGFDAEEAQGYTDSLEGFEPAAGLPATLCSVYAEDPDEIPKTLQRKVWKLLGISGDDEDEAEEALEAPLVPALLHRWKEFPPSFPGSKFAVSGFVDPGGMSGIRVIANDGHKEFDVTEVLERALRATQAFMKEHAIEEKTFCFTGRLESMERADAQGLVAEQGGRTASTVTTEVTLVVAAREAGSKRAKAEKRGLPIINEAEFLRRAGR